MDKEKVRKKETRESQPAHLGNEVGVGVVMMSFGKQLKKYEVNTV